MKAPDGWTLKTWGDVQEGMGDLEGRMHELTAATSTDRPPAPDELLAMIERVGQSLAFVQAAAAWDAPAL